MGTPQTERDAGRLLVGPGVVLTPGRTLAEGGVLIKNGRGGAVAPFAQLAAREPRTPRLDARGALVLPGFINLHTHLHSALARGMAVPGPPARRFVQILEHLWWRLDKRLDPEDLEVSALAGLADALRFFSDEGYLEREWLEARPAERGAVRVVEVDYKRYVGAQIGIHNPRGEKVGRVSHLRNREWLFLAGPDPAALDRAAAAADQPHDLTLPLFPADG